MLRRDVLLFCLLLSFGGVNVMIFPSMRVIPTIFRFGLSPDDSEFCSMTPKPYILQRTILSGQKRLNIWESFFLGFS